MGRLDALKHGTRTRPDEPDTEREWSVPSFVPKAQTAGCGSAPSSPSFSRALGTRIVIASWLLTPPAPAESPSAFHFHRGGGWPPTTAARATPRRRRRRPPPPPPPVELASTIWRTRGSSAAYACEFTRHLSPPLRWRGHGGPNNLPRGLWIRLLGCLLRVPRLDPMRIGSYCTRPPRCSVPETRDYI